MDVVSLMLACLAFLMFGVVVGFGWRYVTSIDRLTDSIEQSITVIAPHLIETEPYQSAWRRRGFDDMMLDGTRDPARVREGWERQEYLIGSDIASAILERSDSG